MAQWALFSVFFFRDKPREEPLNQTEQANVARHSKSRKPNPDHNGINESRISMIAALHSFPFLQERGGMRRAKLASGCVGRMFLRMIKPHRKIHFTPPSPPLLHLIAYIYD